MSPQEAFRKALSMKHIAATPGGTSRDGGRSSFAAILPMRLRPSRFQTNGNGLSTAPDEENFYGDSYAAPAAENEEKGSSGQVKKEEDVEMPSIDGSHLPGNDNSGVFVDDGDWKGHLRGDDYEIPVKFSSDIVNDDC